MKKGGVELAERKRIERVVRQLHQNKVPLSIIAISVELTEKEVNDIINGVANE